MFGSKPIATVAMVAALAVLFSFSARAQNIQPQVPIIVGGDEDMPACGSVGKVEGLDPKGDGFLAVKAAPSLQAARIDKLTKDEHVYVCAFEGDWYGIIYGRPVKQNCNLEKPRPHKGPYKGPCRSGWVHKRWLNPYAG